MSTRQHFTLKNTLRCTLVLILAFLNVARGTDVKFPHLLKQIGNSTRRLHLISEVVQGDLKVQLEEYLDLNTYSQLIQLKWHQTTGEGRQQSTRLITHKINVLILNGKQESVLYQYKPYECASIKLDGKNNLDGDSSWKLFDLSAGPSSPATEEQSAALLAKSIVSTALDSPYLVRIPAQAGDGGSSLSEKWISGVAGLWLAAQFADNGERGPEHPERAVAGKVLLKGDAWRLYRASGLVVDYYIQRNAREPTGHPVAGGFEGPELIVVRHKNQAEDGRQQIINVFQLELDYSAQLAQNLFTLPIGFDCGANPLLSAIGLQFRPNQRSELMQFELVASKTRSAAGTPLVDVLTIELARVEHPLDTDSRLTMFSSREDHYKIIQDHSYRIQYKLLQVPGSASSQTQCFVEHLQYNANTSPRDDERAPINSNRIRFNVNRLELELSEFHLDYLLGAASSAASAPINLEKLRLLNKFDTSDTQSELVFESEVPAEHLDMLVDLAGTQSEFQMRLVRVYEKQRVKSSTVEPSAKISQSALRLVRVLLLVFDAARSEKLAEVRLNLLEDQQILSWGQRAQLFDLTRCRNLEQESMQLVVRYPAEPALIEYVDKQPSLLLERFYGASTNWLPANISSGKRQGETQVVAQKRRLGASLNFLRAPKVELRRAPGGDLELHLTLLEAISPLDSFEQISHATFTTSSGGSQSCDHDEPDSFEQPLLVSSVRECARLCQHLSCRVFAFEPSRECRMSHLMLEGRHDLSLKERQRASTEQAETKTSPRVELVSLPLSQLYFEPQHLRDRAGPDEASLAEFSSYIAHASYDLEEYEEASDEDEDRMTTISRHKRQVSPERMPLFAFDFIDASDTQSEYPAAMSLLVPSQVSIRYLPLILDFARDGPQMERVRQSFSVRYTGKAYKLIALDTSDSIGRMDENERLFRDTANEVYYNLKRVISISQDNCALLCHNIEEFNLQTSSEQTCISFSYSLGDEQCLLLVKTDFNFLTKSPETESERNPREDDHVMELTGGAAAGSPLLELMTDTMGSIVAFRNYLPEFLGPLKIPDLVSGYHATQVIQDDYQKRGLELEWLDALVVESDGETDTHEDIREQCAQKCLERNRSLKRASYSTTEVMCLALDYCTSSTPLENNNNNNNNSDSSLMHHKQVCRLLLIRGEKLHTTREHVKPISALRLRLARPMNLRDTNKETFKPGAIIGHATNICNRYMLSHLYEFNHLSQRQLLMTTGSLPLTRKLAKLSETSYDSNLDTCALECSLRTPTDCLMFVFCQSIQVEGNVHSLERNCTMFKRLTDLVAGRNGDPKLEQAYNEDQSTQQLATSFHKDCHVYVRRQFNSIEQALSDEALEKLTSQWGPPSSREFEHTHLAIGFSILFLIATASLSAFIVHLNRQNGSMAAASRQDVAFMMTEINKHLART